MDLAALSYDIDISAQLLFYDHTILEGSSNAAEQATSLAGRLSTCS